jgi:glycine dehydrogenase subunit 1
MPYISNTDADRRAMLDRIGVDSIDDLLANLPAGVRIEDDLALAPPMSEVDLTRHMQDLAALNQTLPPEDCYLGGGSFVSHVPETVRHLAFRSEFITAYTPYQAEISQGTLQVVFEFQTMMTSLSGLDMANASLYDGATALVEALRMAMSDKRKKRVITAGPLLPRWREVLKTYFAPLDVEWIELSAHAQQVNFADLEEALNDQTAAVAVASPNALGLFEDIPRVAEMVHAKGALLIQAFDPLAVGLFASPGEQGADIAIAEGQCLAQPVQFGGPYLGILAAKKNLVKKMPGRLIGQTVDSEGKTGYVLTFQTREQHIRREKATSNICTNQALVAAFATMHLALLGPQGLRDKAQAIYTRASFMREKLTEQGLTLLGDGQAYFRELALVVPDVDAFLKKMSAVGFLAGLKRKVSEQEVVVISVNEYQLKEDLERFLLAVSECLEGSVSCK